ncbi:hypothetical protein [Bifidobacterium sp. AGR2158]|uniref:hypothetical protein n=1 Tax=Bifidobacterium sp. AGR2158 TaxID=1280675 RepID=UPI00040E788C|nr:hypothetical protein [Bifidobacterium sp. AGR2158]
MSTTHENPMSVEEFERENRALVGAMRNAVRRELAARFPTDGMTLTSRDYEHLDMMLSSPPTQHDPTLTQPGLDALHGIGKILLFVGELLDGLGERDQPV